MTDLNTPVPIREYARMNSCSDTTIQKAIKNGKITGDAIVVNMENDRPLIVPAIADQQWGHHFRETHHLELKLDVKKQTVDTRKTTMTETTDLAQGNTPGPGPDPGPGQDMIPGSDPGQVTPPGANGSQVPGPGSSGVATQVPLPEKMTYTEADRLGKVMDYKMKELKFLQMQGILVERESVFNVLFEFGQEIRLAFQAIPDRVVDNMLAAPTRNDAHQVLFNAITDALESLANMESLPIK